MSDKVLEKPVCRLCLSRDDLQVSIFEEYAKRSKILQMIRICLPITVAKKDGFPATICYDCLSKLKNHYEFCNLSLSAMHTYKSGKSLEKVKAKIEKQLLDITVSRDSGVTTKSSPEFSFMMDSDTYNILRASPEMPQIDCFSSGVSFLEQEMIQQKRFKSRRRRNQELF